MPIFEAWAFCPGRDSADGMLLPILVRAMVPLSSGMPETSELQLGTSAKERTHERRAFVCLQRPVIKMILNRLLTQSFVFPGFRAND